MSQADEMLPCGCGGKGVPISLLLTISRPWIVECDICGDRSTANLHRETAVIEWNLVQLRFMVCPLCDAEVSADWDIHCQDYVVTPDCDCAKANVILSTSAPRLLDHWAKCVGKPFTCEVSCSSCGRHLVPHYDAMVCGWCQRWVYADGTVKRGAPLVEVAR